MDVIMESILLNPSGLDAMAFGSATIIPGVRAHAVLVDGKDSYVRISASGHRLECLGDLTLCPLGGLSSFTHFDIQVMSVYHVA